MKAAFGVRPNTTKVVHRLQQTHPWTIVEKGEAFSPTDLVCTALGTCIITTMAIKATDMGIELKNTVLHVQKYMSKEPPRRIVKIDVDLTLPGLDISEKDKELLQKVGDTCPVARSLAEGVELNVVYNW